MIAEERLEAAGFRGTEAVVLINGADPTTASGRERTEEVTRQVNQVDGVRAAAGYLETGERAFISDAGDATYLVVQFDATADDEVQDTGESLVAALEGEDDLSVGGNAVAQMQVNEKVESDLQRAEMIAFPILFLLSLLFFRSLVAAALPLLIGALAIVSTMVLLRAASELTSVSIFALNLVTGLGLGLAIDYSLFVVSRYREELARSGPGLTALRRTMATSGRTVLYSSLTVAAALAALTVFPQNFLRSMGIGGTLVALAAALISLTVLPAVLALLGNRVNSLSPAFLQRRAEADSRPATDGFWYRLSRTVMRAPGRIALASTVFLVALGIPFFSIQFTSVDAQVLPADASARQVDDVLRSEFPPFRDAPVRLAVAGDRAAAQTVADEAADADGATAVGAPQRVDERPVGGRRGLVGAAARPGERGPRRRAPRAAPGSAGQRLHGELRRPAGQPGGAPAARAGAGRDRDLHRAVPDDRLGDPADQAAR